MLDQVPDDRVAELWRRLSGDTDAFRRPGLRIVEGQGRVTRPGWCGIVALADAAIVCTPPQHLAAVQSLRVLQDDPSRATNLEVLIELLGPLQEILGPADLQYGSVAEAPTADLSGPFSYDDPLVQDLLQALPEEDRSEAGFDDDRVEGIYVAMEGDHPVALAGHRSWESLAAHIGVVTRPDARGRGHGYAAAVAAASHGTRKGLIVQWRSHEQNSASRRLGNRVGLTQCGRQVSFRMLT